MYTKLLNQNILHRPALHQYFPCPVICVRLQLMVPTTGWHKCKSKTHGFLAYTWCKYLFLSCRYSHSFHSQGDLWSVVSWQHWTSTPQVQNGKSPPVPSTYISSMTVCSCLGRRSECFNHSSCCPFQNACLFLGLCFGESPFPLPASKWQYLSSHSPNPTLHEYHVSM